MSNVKKVTDSIFYVGVNDHQVDLFEGQYVVPNGMSYNSYVIMDDKIAVMDTVDVHFGNEWISNIEEVLNGKKPDYLVIQHMEMDHAGSIRTFKEKYPDAQIVGNAQIFQMMRQFYGENWEDKQVVVENGGTLSFGKHTLTFVFAPMVHWPEVMVSYESTEKVLFSADGFGKFGANDVEEDWDDESRRYFIGIVGKYGQQVQNLLKVAATLDIQIICPLHGPVLTDNLGHYISLYDKWSSYSPEEDGIVVAYTSVYGDTKEAALLLAEKLKEKACPKVVVHDLARCDMALAIADAFKYSKLVLATTTYNADIYPFMKDYIHRLTERNFCNRSVAFIENGSWSPRAMLVMKEMLKEGGKLYYTKNNLTIWSGLTDENKEKLEAMANELCQEYIAASDKLAVKDDISALFKIGYGLYVVTSNDGNRDNGLIVNTVTQVSENPTRIAVGINKKNYSCETIEKTKKLNVNVLSERAVFSVFQRFGFQSGRDVDKFEGIEVNRTDNGLPFLKHYINAVISLEVDNMIDMVSHTLFICEIKEMRLISDDRTITYNFYQENVKPKPATEGKKGWICKVCGFIYEEEDLPADYICPICKHGVADFEKIQ
ncbi:Flavorubredoxin [Acetitomaculum ruminis DSM 5522]|uniref:Flavorubredoxin n=1 Tax=Acetitomaculum ruminis DSM 5522 TaxID=1120918 RepID=A0A1I0ZDP2_9FIRM|nr:flavin reductase [Acetitomaculum ruminis]SFB22538.1 Flavorubredoxin [Acetitomaculum ruminis DSM 5522]